MTDLSEKFLVKYLQTFDLFSVWFPGHTPKEWGKGSCFVHLYHSIPHSKDIPYVEKTKFHARSNGVIREVLALTGFIGSNYIYYRFSLQKIYSNLIVQRLYHSLKPCYLYLLGQLGELASAVPVGGIVGWLSYSFHVVLHVFPGVVGVIRNVL